MSMYQSESHCAWRRQEQISVLQEIRGEVLSCLLSSIKGASPLWVVTILFFSIWRETAQEKQKQMKEYEVSVDEQSRK